MIYYHLSSCYTACYRTSYGFGKEGQSLSPNKVQQTEGAGGESSPATGYRRNLGSDLIRVDVHPYMVYRAEFSSKRLKGAFGILCTKAGVVSE